MAPREKADPWKAHRKDVARLVMDEKEYIVYVNHAYEIEWETSEYHDKLFQQKSQKVRSGYHEIMSDVAATEVVPCEGLSTEMQIHFKRLIGEAIVCVFEYDYENARRMLKFAAAYVQSRSEEKSRFWYLSAAAVMTVPFLIAGLLIWNYRFALIGDLGEPAFWLLISVAAGACGALFSVTTRTGTLAFNSSSGKIIHFLDAASRIWAGAFSGVVTMLAVQSKLALTILSDSSKGHLAWVLVAFAGGVSERLAPSIIASFDKTSVKPADGKRDHAKTEPQGSPESSPKSQPRNRRKKAAKK